MGRGIDITRNARRVERLQNPHHIKDRVAKLQCEGRRHPKLTKWFWHQVLMVKLLMWVIAMTVLILLLKVGHLA